MNQPQPSTSGIAAEHQEILQGIEKVYGILIDLDYVQNTDVQVPPHGNPKDPVAVAPLRSAGVDPMAIEVIGRLPCFTNDITEKGRETENARDGIAIAPFTAATSYLLGSGRHDEAREVGDDQLLPPTTFKLATTACARGYNFAYDLTDKTIIKWRDGNWIKSQRVPVGVFFDDWTTNLRSLNWLPWRDESGWEIETRQPNCDQNVADPESSRAQEARSRLESEKIEAISTPNVDGQNTSHSRYWARRRIYEECGWPETFDKERFRQRREELNRRGED